MQEKYRDPYPYGFGNVIKASEEVVGTRVTVTDGFAALV